MVIETIPRAAVASVRAAAASRAPGGGAVESLLAELDAIAGALRVAADACTTAGSRVCPAGIRGEPIGSRYDRAVGDWPVAPPPSRERLASLLTSLHEAAAMAGRAAAQCDQARRSLDAALNRPTTPTGAARRARAAASAPQIDRRERA